MHGFRVLFLQSSFQFSIPNENFIRANYRGRGGRGEITQNLWAGT